MNARAGGTYLYAVLAGAQEARAEGLLGIEGGELSFVSEGELVAAVSRVSRTRLRPERKHLLAHQSVLRRLMEHGSVLPAAFGLVARGDEAVLGLLRENRALLLEQFQRVAGKVEMGLRVSWTAPDVFAYFLARHPELHAARERLSALPAVSQEELIGLGKLFERFREADRQAHAERVAAVLQARGIELKWNPPRGEREVLSAACLVPRAEAAIFEHTVEAAAAGFDDSFTFEFNGPWAPHSFTELKLTAFPSGGCACS